MESFASGFVGELGIEVTHASGDLVRSRMEVGKRHLQPYGIVHGGVYCSIVETLASAGGAIWAIEQGMSGCVGVSNTTDFLNSCTAGDVLEAAAAPIHRGGSQQLWQVEIHREGDRRLVARGTLRLQNLTRPSSAALPDLDDGSDH